MDVFFADEYTLYVASVCDIKILEIQLIFNYIRVTTDYTVRICFEKVLSMASIERLILFEHQDIVTSYALSHSASNPVLLTQLPLFYPLTFARSRKGELILASITNFLALLLKDDQGRLVVSVYDVLKNVHESLLVSQYLMHNGTHLTQDQVYASVYFQTTAFSAPDSSLYFFFLSQHFFL